MVSAKLKNKKQQPNRKSKPMPQDSYDWLHQIAFWGLALLLFFPPYFRGLFFASEQEKALVFGAVVFWIVFLWRWLQGDNRFLVVPLDYFAVALPLIYLLSFFVAVNKGLAVEEIVKNILYFFTFWSVTRLVRHEQDVEKILKVIYISALGVAVAGLATATGLINIKDGFNVAEGRIYSTFQYPNALASYLGAVILIGIYLWDRAREWGKETLEVARDSLWDKLSQKGIINFFLICSNFILLAVLLGTKSRGGLLVFVLVFLISLIGVKAEDRLITTLHLGYLACAAYFSINKFISAAANGYAGQAWLWVLAGIALAIGGQVAFSYFDRKVLAGWSRNKWMFNITFGVLAILVFAAVGFGIASNPEQVQKVADFDYLRNALDRIYYMETAVEMIKERPLLGWGGGGWEEAYKAFLDYRYTTRQVHSYYFQLGVETGILGLLAVAGLWLSFLYVGHRLYHGSKDNPRRRKLVWTITMAFLLITGHALIDFDLSLSALTLVLWTLLGLGAGLYQKDLPKENTLPSRNRVTPRWVSVTAVSVVVVLILVGSFCLIQSRVLMSQGVTLLKSGHAARGLEYMERSVNYNPFKSSYRVALSQVYKSLGKEEKAMAQANQAVTMSRFDPEPRNNLAEVAIAVGNNDAAAVAVEKTQRLAPNNVETYEKMVETYNELGLAELKEGNKDQAKKFFTKCISVPEEMMKYKSSLDKTAMKMWMGPELKINNKLEFLMGVSNYWLGNFSAAESSLIEAAQGENLKGEALLYQALVKEQKGQKEAAKQLLVQSIEINPQAEHIFESLKELPVLND